jgi:hypothetical protein
MVQELREVVLDRRDEIRLGYTDGKIHLYKGFNLPEVLQEPLVFSPNGQIPAFTSNERGALVKAGKWFKLKGIKPKPNQIYEETGEPLGGMSSLKAIRELEANERVNRGYEKYGYRGSLIPAAYIEYDIPFGDENVCCAISQTLGDTRVLYMFLNKFSKALKEKDKSLGKFFTKVSGWAGFADRVLKEQNIAISKYSSDLGNFTFYELSNGYGICPVDLSSAELDTGKATRSKIFGMLDIPRVGNFLGDSLLHKRMEGRYLSAFEGKSIPEPIERDLVMRFVG